MKKLNTFIGLYPIQKTIRFELKPQGKTLEYIVNNGLLNSDEHRAESYLLVKKIIDNYHKLFISKTLNGFKLELLDEFYLYYQLPRKEDKEKKGFNEIQSKLRKQIADRFTKNEGFKNLFLKELFKQDLINFVKFDNEKKLIEEFQNFTTYFTGYNENRRNMYSSEDKSTAIAFRLIHQNLPKFIDNMRTFEKIIISPLKSQFPKILSELEEILQIEKIEEMFTLDYFNYTLTQQGIDVYNHLLDGYSKENGEKIKGLNEYINLYNQSVKTKEQRIGKLKPLFKQILSDRSTASFIPEEFTDDNEVLKSINEFYQEINSDVLSGLKELLQNLHNYEVSKVYLSNDVSLTDISQKMFGDWSIIQKAFNKWFEAEYKGKAPKDSEKYEEEQKKYFNKQESYSIEFINNCLSLLDCTDYNKKIEDYYSLLGERNELSEKKSSLFEQIKLNYENICGLLNSSYPDDNNLAQDQPMVDKIKLFLDSIKELQWYIKPLLGKGNEPDKDERFYGDLTALWSTLDQITPLYNKVRNYMTRKPYSTKKIKLNFENSTLLDGWDVNKEPDNSCVILRKDNLFYLAIMDKKHNKIFKKKFNSSNDDYEKVEYKLLPGANKMLPKVFFSNSRIKEFNPSNTLLENYKNDTHKKGANFKLKDCHELIDFFKSSIYKHEDWKHFGFQFSETETYQDLSGFYREVEQQGYKITFRNIPKSYIDQMVDEGKLYLFQIYNKDFSPYSKGTPNMHTLYWKMLFETENLKNVVYKLNGQAEIFYRESSIKEENKIVHKANRAIDNKNKLSKKEQSIFEYDITKDKRYTIDKFQFHVPITLNFKSPNLSNINDEVNNFIKANDNQHIIGIDRGERNLLYITLIDGKGNIKEQFSLNEIINNYKGNTYKTDYRQLLDAREDRRDEERKSWKTIETIKELKEGYLSQVIHKISEMIVKYNAIVVLEDLNGGFMRGRQKVEKQVYQKFEKMLIDKLNYLVDKNKAASEDGGTLRAYQFTNQFESFQKVGKQSGFLFYIPAWNTSKMDPVTGFVNLFDTHYENIEKAKNFFSKFDVIQYNKKKKYFEFKFDYNRFTAKAEGTKTHWILCTNNERIETFRNPQKNSQWDNRTIMLTDAFKELFTNYGIDYETGNNIKDIISIQTEKSFFYNENKNGLLQLLKLTLQMRNSISNTDIDYIISPIANEKGDFFDSREANEKLPKDADANGAYNIARKGLWVVEQIKQANNISKLKLAISNKEWLAFAQNMNE
jgi:CRISPR-associated protein Cpf1